MSTTTIDCTTSITTPGALMPYLTKYTKKRQEHFVVITLDGAHQVIKARVVTIGTANKCQVHPREVFFAAIRDNAIAIIIAHNHPSGSLTPSDDDALITLRLAQAGNLLGIQVLDHIIVSKNGYYSYIESGTFPVVLGA